MIALIAGLRGSAAAIAAATSSAALTVPSRTSWAWAVASSAVMSDWGMGPGPYVTAGPVKSCR